MKLRTEQLLGYAGLAPFITGAIIAWLSPQAGVWLSVTYGAIILSFMAGTLWGQALGKPRPINLLLVSNALALTGWAAVGATAAGYPACALLGLTAAFGVCWLYERQHLPADQHYRRLRTHLTLGVSVCLIIACTGLLAPH